MIAVVVVDDLLDAEVLDRARVGAELLDVPVHARPCRREHAIAAAACSARSSAPSSAASSTGRGSGRSCRACAGWWCHLASPSQWGLQSSTVARHSRSSPPRRTSSADASPGCAVCVWLGGPRVADRRPHSGGERVARVLVEPAGLRGLARRSRCRVPPALREPLHRRPVEVLETDVVGNADRRVPVRPVRSAPARGVQPRCPSPQRTNERRTPRPLARMR